jgi:hypothetical protein
MNVSLETALENYRLTQRQLRRSLSFNNDRIVMRRSSGIRNRRVDAFARSEVVLFGYCLSLRALRAIIQTNVHYEVVAAQAVVTF